MVRLSEERYQELMARRTMAESQKKGSSASGKRSKGGKKKREPAGPSPRCRHCNGMYGTLRRALDKDEWQHVFDCKDGAPRD